MIGVMLITPRSARRAAWMSARVTVMVQPRRCCSGARAPLDHQAYTSGCRRRVVHPAKSIARAIWRVAPFHIAGLTLKLIVVAQLLAFVGGLGGQHAEAL